MLVYAFLSIPQPSQKRNWLYNVIATLVQSKEVFHFWTTMLDIAAL